MMQSWEEGSACGTDSDWDRFLPLPGRGEKIFGSCLLIVYFSAGFHMALTLIFFYFFKLEFIGIQNSVS